MGLLDRSVKSGRVGRLFLPKKPHRRLLRSGSYIQRSSVAKVQGWSTDLASEFKLLELLANERIDHMTGWEIDLTIFSHMTTPGQFSIRRSCDADLWTRAYIAKGRLGGNGPRNAFIQVHYRGEILNESI